ncbi:hypothetical protein RJT34_16747 [Clitoria ternatea]|uniref:Uncharacterized protein n=1 Tax=Clitoria ternatea TaxID=43366 RepID=A0AAN9PCI3_CLITE
MAIVVIIGLRLIESITYVKQILVKRARLFEAEEEDSDTEGAKEPNQNVSESFIVIGFETSSAPFYVCLNTFTNDSFHSHLHCDSFTFPIILHPTSLLSDLQMLTDFIIFSLI